MKTYKQWLKSIPPVVVNTVPVHGSHHAHRKHSNDNEPVVVTATPVHGSHAHRDPIISEHIDDSTPEHLQLEKEADSAHIRRSDKQAKAVEKYTYDSGGINRPLIHNATLGHSGYTKNTHDHITALDSVTDHVYGHAHSLYHGAGFNPDSFASKHPDRHIKLPGFTSTSVDKDQAHKFARAYGTTDEHEVHNSHVLHIHTNSTDKGVPLMHHSSSSNEKEVLLPRNTVLKVHHKPEIDIQHRGTGKYSKTHHVHYWHAEIVSQHHEPVHNLSDVEI